ncbi:hypothetical protein J2Z83_001683 [Virgibacillus natechei]|uniref:DUF2515 domain-containing protein n=1 Tax=Virgibacillus natechei TaxID=1216297 RepID=A0ABS4IGY9_9BACI|nr:DUF2515 family protein [Virgibacillus natechei]MBP1969576.1 hypothetical protein [Virgibacillus natechei]UZD14804.1 DUF2515 domain-containing protein [Virgibacillus natechei]
MYNEQKEQSYIHYITNCTRAHNIDNISRTKAYQNFFVDFPEIKWAFVASMVSRNAGWNMTDLHLPPFQKILSDKERSRLFMTYERANWLIFSDAYPQLLVYKLSLSSKKPMFYLLKEYNASQFMINEWYHFWKSNNQERLMIALIINEQNVIQTPVIKQPFFKHHVFHKFPYLLQDSLFMNAVILPTRSPKLYGAFVHDFTNVTKRIELGKKIAGIIYSPNIFPTLIEFALTNEHTGSRIDYEIYLNMTLPKSPMLRLLYPVISHQDIIRNDWSKSRGVKKKWLQHHNASTKKSDIGSAFYKKRNMLYAYYHLKNIVTSV